jgi:hypothetical protein
MFSLLGVALHNGDISAWTIGVYDHGTTSLKLSMAIAGLSAATNFFSTLLISWKAWCVSFPALGSGPSLSDICFISGNDARYSIL